MPICRNGHRSILDISDGLAAYVPLPWSTGRSFHGDGDVRRFDCDDKIFQSLFSSYAQKSSAIIYSITETAKANNRNPFRYLEYVLTMMKDHQENTDYRFMEGLLPWPEQLPESVKAKQKQQMCKPAPETTAKKYAGNYDLWCTIIWWRK